MAQPTVQEQLMLELVNRARLDPLAEALRFGINLNKDLAAGTLNGTAKPVLAMNELLIDAARLHSQHMIDTDEFAHEGIGDGTPHQRMEDAGYVFSGSWSSGENIAIQGTTGTVNLTTLTLANHEGLFESAGHRLNILSTSFRELGIGIKSGPFVFDGNPTVFNAVDATQNFARSGTQMFVTGVCITDADRDNFYDIGEQRAGITVQIRQAGVLVGSDATGTAGGYAVGAAAGACDVRFSGGGLATAVNCTVNTTNGNVKVDLAGANEVLCSGSVTLGVGALHATLLGVAALSATGNTAANTLLGNKGANVLRGLDGVDQLFGGAGTDQLFGGTGNDRLTGNAGRDLLTGDAGADIFDYNAIAETGKTATTRDLIRDFVHLSDRIDLSTIDAVTGGANNAFVFIGTNPFGLVGGQLRFRQSDVTGTANDRTFVEGDVNGDGLADFQIELQGLVALTAADFIL